MTRISQSDLARDALYTKVNQIADEKQDVLEFDTTPTSNSDNPVTSSGVKSALDIKANDDEVVHKSGNETIAGSKTFTNNSFLQKANPTIVLNNTGATKGTAPSSNLVSTIITTANSNSVTDADTIGGIRMYMLTDKGSRTDLWAYDCHTSGATSGSYIAVGYNSNGAVYTHAPAPTDTTTTSSTQIATTGWVNSTNNNVVHKTNSEQIAGVKRFVDNGFVLKSTSMDRTVTPSAMQINQLYYQDKNDKTMGYVRNARYSDGLTRIELIPVRDNNGSNAEGGALSIALTSSGTSYATAPASDANSAILTTVNKSKTANGYFQLGNGLIVQWGSLNIASGTAASDITFPKAFTSDSAFRVVACSNTTGSTVTVHSETKTKFTVTKVTSSANIYVKWIAVGV